MSLEASSVDGPGTTACWHLRLCGPPHLVSPEGRRHALERRDAALLALLAIEGPTARTRALALLWPDEHSEQVRGRLRQRLFVLKRKLGVEVVEGSQTLALGSDLVWPGLDHDSADAPLLGDDAHDDLPEFAAWLRAARTRLQAQRRERLTACAGRLEREGRLAEAIVVAEQILALEPLQEHGHRRLMRLHYLRGDRAAALLAFDRCERLLKDEVGARPSAETLALLAQVESAQPVTAVVPRVPLTVLRPPRLVGRAAEWAQLTAAWQAGAAVVIAGEPGMGKSRLVADLVSNVPGALLVPARPGDRDAPYAVLARLLRAILPGVTDAIAPGVRKELARLLPELGDAEPMKNAAARARFLNAIEVLLAQAVREGLAGVVVDDLQYADAASIEALQHLSGRFPAFAWVVTYRTAELSPAGAALVETLTKARDACAFVLAPLAPPQIVELIESLGVADLNAAAIAAPLARRTGGNPFFLLEAIKSTLTRNTPDCNAVASPALTGVGALIERRLARLSPEAVRLARCAAVAGQDHSIDLAAAVLGVRPLDLADAWAELETAQILHDAAFAHDLVYEAALASVPAPIARHLHGEIAAYLLAHGGAPSRVALHFEAARKPLPAADWWIKAAQAAERALRFAEAADAFERSARLFGECGRDEQAFDAAYLMRLACFEVDLVTRSNAALALLDRFAATPVQRARAHNEHAVTRLHRGETAETERHALAGLIALGGADAPLVRAELRRNLAAVLAFRNDTAAALREMRSVQADVERFGSPAERFQLWDSLSILLNYADECDEAAVLNERATTLAIEMGNLPGAAQTVLNLAVQQIECGEARRAMSTLERARNLLAAVGDDATPYSSLHLNYGLAQRALGDYAGALDNFDRALERARAQTPGWMPLLAAAKAQTLTFLGQFARAQQTLAADAPVERTPALAATKWQTAQYLLALAQRRAAGTALSTFLAGYPANGRRIVRWRLEAANLAGRDGDPASIDLARQLAREATAATRFGVAIHLHARAAAEARRQQQGETAREHARAALALMNDYAPDDIYPGEVMQIAIAALRDGDDSDQAEAKAALRKAAAWVRQVATERVPAEFRDSFLARNAANREILTSASRLLRN